MIEILKEKFDFDNNILSDDDKYICSLILNEIKINVYLSDYGQCYCFNYLKNSVVESQACSTYNGNFLDEIVADLDYNNYRNYDYNSLYEQIRRG